MNDVVNVGYDPDPTTGEVVFWAALRPGRRRDQRRTREQLDADPDLAHDTVRALVVQLRDQPATAHSPGETLALANPSIGRWVDPTAPAALVVGETTHLSFVPTGGGDPVDLTPYLVTAPPARGANPPRGPTGILDRIDDTLTFYSAGLGGEITVPVERDGTAIPWPDSPPAPEPHHDGRTCADTFTVVLHHHGGTIRHHYCYAKLLSRPDDVARVHAWLDEHGIEHTTVPLDTLIVVNGPARTVRVRVLALDASGSPYLDGDEVALATVTVRLHSPWPLEPMPRGESPRTRRWWRHHGERSLWPRRRLAHTYTPTEIQRRARRWQHPQPDNMARIHTDYHRRHK